MALARGRRRHGGRAVNLLPPLYNNGMAHEPPPQLAAYPDVHARRRAGERTSGPGQPPDGVRVDRPGAP